MTGISKITDKILAEARADAAEKLLAADARCAQIAEEAAKRAEVIREEIEEAAKREAAEIIFRAKSGETMARRNTVLEARSVLIDEAFSVAKKEILRLSEERYLEMLVMLLGSVLKQQLENEKESRELYGEEDAPTFDSYEVLLNEQDLSRYGECLLKELQKRRGEELSTVIGRVSMAKTPVAIDGGLILRVGAMEINCSLATLFTEIRPELEAKVAQKLFPQKKGS